MAEKTMDNTQNKENQIAKCEETREPETYVTPVTDIYAGLFVTFMGLVRKRMS